MRKNKLVGRRVVVRQVYGTTASDEHARQWLNRVGTVTDVIDQDGVVSGWPILVRFNHDTCFFKPEELQYLNNKPVKL